MPAEMDWRAVAAVLATELKRWGWGDFHYGAQPQDPRVLAALKVYEDALVIDGVTGGDGD